MAKVTITKGNRQQAQKAQLSKAADYVQQCQEDLVVSKEALDEAEMDLIKKMKRAKKTVITHNGKIFEIAHKDAEDMLKIRRQQ